MDHTNRIGMKFILIPPGEFTMGSSPAEIEEALKTLGANVGTQHWQAYLRSEGPQHKVILTQPVYLSVQEVTQAAYTKIMGQNPSHFAATGLGKDAVTGIETASHPVVLVSWNDAAEFCAKLSQHEHLQPIRWRSGDHFPNDGIQIARQVRPLVARGWAQLIAMRKNRLDHGDCSEQPLAGQQKKQRAAETVAVGAGVGLVRVGCIFW